RRGGDRAGVSRMDAASIERVLGECERDARPDLSRLGFWKAIAAVKRDRALVDRYADRIGRIDRAAFERSVPLHFPLAVGVGVDLAGIGIASGLFVLSTELTSRGRDLVFLMAFGALLVATHTLAHWI